MMEERRTIYVAKTQPIDPREQPVWYAAAVFRVPGTRRDIVWHTYDECPLVAIAASLRACNEEVKEFLQRNRSVQPQ